MGQGLRLVLEQQGDVAGRGLLLQQAQAQATALDRIGILPALQAVPRPPEAEPPFSLSRMLSLDCEMAGPPRRFR